MGPPIFSPCPLYRRYVVRCHPIVVGVIWLAMLVGPPAAFAQTGMNRMGSARDVALGHASTADPHSTGLHINPAISAATEQASATFFARQPFGIAELRHASVSASFPARWVTFQSGTGTFGFNEYRETFGTIAFSRAVPVGTSLPIYVGIRANAHHLSISEYGSDQALAADAGVLVPVLPVLTLGVHARNVSGGSIAGSSLPRSLAVGAHYAAGPRVLVTADVLKDVAFPWSLRGGVEIRPVDALSLRIGATRHPVRFSAGVGINLGPIRADMAGERHPTLGWSPSGGLTISL